jgi:hypothetical protein
MAWEFPEMWDLRYEVLLDTAKKLRDDGHNEAAIVTAQTACEVYTQLVLTSAFRAAVPDHAVDALEKLMPGYSLNHGRVRDVYVAFSGDRIQEDKALWSRFVEHVKRRHEIVHRGREATLEETSASISVVEEVIAHMIRNARWERTSD